MRFHASRTPAALATLLLTVFLLTLSCSGLVASEEEVEQEFVVGEAPRVSLTHLAGVVRVQAAAAPVFKIKTRRRLLPGAARSAAAELSKVRVEVRATVGQASAQFVCGAVTEWEMLKEEARAGRLAGLAADYEIQAPKRSSLEVSSVSGEVVIQGIEGGVEFNGVNAPVLFERVGGGCRVATMGGPVTVAGLLGGLAVEGVGGKISGCAIRGACVIDTVGGEVELEVNPAETQVTRVHSMNGAVKVTLPPRASADVHLETTAGTIRCDFALPGEGTLLRSGKLGAGGATISIVTANGPIQLLRREGR